ncbi:MAG: DNA repair protein RadA [Prevotellaceae bacterium]|jgi:DNA repair protein RadA/Sms|nr:DNA repair protein RadA [Prevotellaceae bacterium]
MSKIKKAYFCQNCGYESPKWLGNCPSCGEWNAFVEELVSKSSSGTAVKSLDRGRAKPEAVKDISPLEYNRIELNNGEMNRLLGGGLVPGSIALVGGEPGIGKSTLSLQIALNQAQLKTLYVSGEESLSQIKLRADRLGGGESANCLVLAETSLENILTHADENRPDFIVIDSIQTIYTDRIESSPGSVSQIRECAALLMRYAKESNTPVFLIGHITKDGAIAGPKVLEHIVDVVLQFEGDNHYVYRLLRSIKNRFGSTSEIGIFEMTGSGLREVSNPSEVLITKRDEELSGVSVAVMIDGARSFLIETQALVSTAAYGTPQRSATGFDARRLNMLLAVLEKRAGFKLASKDVFLNIAGGIKVSDPATDLAVMAAILSSNLDTAIRQEWCFAGEVGLSGEIRPVNRIDIRVSEAEKLGFKKIFISKYNRRTPELKKTNIDVRFVSKVSELVRELFSGNN